MDEVDVITGGDLVGPRSTRGRHRKISWPFVRFEVVGESMQPLYLRGQRVLVCRWGRIRSGDVVVFNRDGLPMLKRAIEKCEDGWMVRGDNRAQSTDSADFGPVKEKEIIGRVCFKY